MTLLHKSFLIVPALLLSAAISSEGADRDIFKAKLESSAVAASFLSDSDWFPYPDYEDREGWSKLFAADSAEVVRRAEKLLDYKWQYIPATAYLAFERTGDRSAMENIERANRGAYNTFLFAELAEGKGRFIDQLIDGVYLATERTSWVLSAHQSSQRTHRSLPDYREHTIDLASGRMGAALSLIYHFFHREFDKVDPSVSIALKAAIKRNILDSFLDEGEADANWWMARKATPTTMLNNWTPWCTADVMLSFFLMEEDRERLNQAIRLSVGAMDAFFNYIKPDGACEEGPGYWFAAAGKSCNWLQLMYDASSGAFDMFDNPRIRSYGEYISRAYVGNGYVINFADASPKMDAGGKTIIYFYGRALDSREMKDFAMYLCADTKNGRFVCPPSIGSDTYRYLECLRFAGGMRSAADSLNALCAVQGFEKTYLGLRESVPYVTEYPQTQMYFLRNRSRWFLGAKGGFNDESHNHNDIGSCVLYVRDTPVLADAGVGTYTKATFNAKLRYGIWTMQGWWHNLPVPNGIDQKYGRQYAAGEIKCNARKGTLTIDMTKAYPDSASVRSLSREYRMSPSDVRPCLTIRDRIGLSRRNSPDEEHFLVKGTVTPGGEGSALIETDGVKVCMTYPKGMKLTVEEKILDDRKLSSVWGGSLRLIRLISSSEAPLDNEYVIKFTEE